jgi:hypothetical protein
MGLSLGVMEGYKRGSHTVGTVSITLCGQRRTLSLYTERLFQISRSPSVHSKDRRRSRFSVDYAHLQDSFDVPRAEVFSELIS